MAFCSNRSFQNPSVHWTESTAKTLELRREGCVELLTISASPVHSAPNVEANSEQTDREQGQTSNTQCLHHSFPRYFAFWSYVFMSLRFVFHDQAG